MFNLFKNNGILTFKLWRIMNFKENVVYMGLQDHMLPCISKRVFDMECPGCGLQRSIAFLISGDFIAAFNMYPAIFTLIPLFIIVAVNKLVPFKHAQVLL